MLKPSFASIRYAYFSLLCVGLAWVVPFLIPIHRLPITTFYQEWSAAVLGLCAMPLLATRRCWQQPEIPRIVLLPIGLMMLILVQYAFGKMEYVSQALLGASYLLWAALMVLVGQRMRIELGLPMVATVLAAVLLLGAELSAVIGILQHFRWHTFLDRVIMINSEIVCGNIAQANHFASYISVGLASLGLLYVRYRLRVWQVILLAMPLLFVLPLSGSRSPWLYLTSFVVMAYFWQRRSRENRPLQHYSLLLLLGMAFMQFAVLHISWLAGQGGTTAFDRVVAEAMGGGGWRHNIRLQVWYEAWLVFIKFPILGAGFGQFAWQHFLLGPLLKNPMITGIYGNAHNIVMHTAAEMGLAGLLVCFSTALLWLRQAWKGERSIYQWWGLGVLAVLGIHSMLEYPLWYTYFLGMAAFVLGLLDMTAYRLELRGVGRLSVVAIVLMGALSLGQAWKGYHMLADFISLKEATKSKEEFYNDMLMTHRQVLLRPYVELAMTSIMEGHMDWRDMRDLNESVMYFIPASTLVYREALILARFGEAEAARKQLERAIWAFPGHQEWLFKRLGELEKRDPVHYAGLLEFATRIHKERESAIRAK